MLMTPKGSITSRLPELLWLVAAVGLTACSVDDGRPGAPGVGVSADAKALTAIVTDVKIASAPVVQLTVTNESGIRFVGLAASNVRFTLAKLSPGSDGLPSYWQNYINRLESPNGVGPGTEAKLQGTSESNGTFVSHGDGTYTYTFATDITKVTNPLAVAYEPGLTHRLGLQISGGALPATNAVHTWRPADGATAGIFQRDIVQTASCNECHGKLAVHGGGRLEVQYCVTCHNPGSTDANSGNTVDFKVMIHKIHRGEHLPSVETGGEYAIWGFGNRKNDYSDVAYPQDIRNCSKCHDDADTATPQAHNWWGAPSVEACGACHDSVNFATGAGHSSESIVAQNGQCTICHGTNSSGGSFAGTVQASHTIPSKVLGAKYRLNILSATNTGPGQFPVVTYAITDPTNNDARYNIVEVGNPVWTSASVALLLGWDTRDYHNAGNGSATTPASAVSLNGKAASTGNNAAPAANPDGSFTVTSLRAIPADVTGSGVVGMTARIGADFDGDGTYSDRVPVKSVVSYFPVTDATAVPRRRVVDIVQQCDRCHDQLTLHGDNRTDEPQLCVICHNARNTDINRRPADPMTALDGKKEESVHLKRLIHGIHAAGFREKGLVIYGFGNSVNDFGDVRFPGILSNCRTCHLPNTFTLPLATGSLATTVDSGASRSDPGDDISITPIASACSSCHDGDLAQTHMEQNGASFNMVGDPGSYDETCAVCHGPGRLADVAEVHHVTP